MIEQFPYFFSCYYSEQSNLCHSIHILSIGLFLHSFVFLFCIKSIVRPVAVDQCVCIIIFHIICLFYSTISYAQCDTKYCLKNRKSKSFLFFCTFHVPHWFLVFSCVLFVLGADLLMMKLSLCLSSLIIMFLFMYLCRHDGRESPAWKQRQTKCIL